MGPARGETLSTNDVSWNEGEEESDEEEDILGGIQSDEANKFDTLCDGVTNTMALLHESMQEFLEFKDALLQHFLPPSVLLKVSLTSSKVYRSVTDMQEPIQELIRLVKIFSTPWEEKSAALKKLHEDFHKKQRQLDVAIRRLSNVDAMSKKIAHERKVLNWEKLYCKVTSARGHGRRWKYTIESLKEKAKQGYDILVHHVDQIEQGISEPFPDQDLHTESAVPQMDPIVEESERESQAGEESGEEHFSVGSDEESDPDETLNSAYSINQVPIQMEPPKPETKDEGQSTHPPEYDIILNVRCYCPKGIEGREIKCSVTHGAQYQKSSQLDLTDEEQAQLHLEAANAPPPKPKGPMRRGAPPPPPPEPPKPKIVKFSELRFPLLPKKVGRREFPPALQSLTVTVHTGPEEDIVGMSTVEAEDVEGCEMPEVFKLPDSQGQYDLSLRDSCMYTAHSTVDSELQLDEPLPVSFPIYPLEGGRAGSELKAIGSVPLFFYYTKVYKPKQLDRGIGTVTLRELILEEIGVDINHTTKDSLFPDRKDLACSPMTVDTPPPPSRLNDENAVPIEEYDAVVEGYQRDMRLLQAQYESKLTAMEAKMLEMEEELSREPQIIYQDKSDEKSVKQSPFIFKKEKREARNVVQHQRLPKWGEGLPEDFFERLEMFAEESEANKRAIAETIKREQAENIEKKLAFQNKAHRGSSDESVAALKDLTLPALFMPTPGANVFNPRAHNYYHPTGSTGTRLTQPPSMMNLPPLKSKMAVLNLFDLGQNAQTNPNIMLQQYINMRQSNYSPMKMAEAPTNTADPTKPRGRSGRKSTSAGQVRDRGQMTRELTFDSAEVRS